MIFFACSSFAVRSCLLHLACTLLVYSFVSVSSLSLFILDHYAVDLGFCSFLFVQHLSPFQVATLHARYMYELKRVFEVGQTDLTGQSNASLLFYPPIEPLDGKLEQIFKGLGRYYYLIKRNNREKGGENKAKSVRHSFVLHVEEQKVAGWKKEAKEKILRLTAIRTAPWNIGNGCGLEDSSLKLSPSLTLPCSLARSKMKLSRDTGLPLRSRHPGLRHRPKRRAEGCPWRPSGCLSSWHLCTGASS